jgi:hypothetical protein
MDTYTLTKQPDRLIKLSCPKCGAIARMSTLAILRTRSEGIVCAGDGATFVPAARRQYVPRRTAEVAVTA